MKAAVLEAINQPLTVRDIPDYTKLEPGQVLVRVLCAGICGAQLQEIDGQKGDPSHLPHLLGHEACGIVESASYEVTSVKKGDKVVMHWRKGKGWDRPGGTFGNVKSGPITTFSEYSVVSENRLTKIPKEVPKYLAALLGCALSTALSIALKQVPTDSRVLVVGCGGVGLCLILAARNRTANLTGIDLWDKREIVESLGARFSKSLMMHGVGEEFDVILDTTGKCEFGHRLATNGKYIVIGQTDQIDMHLPNFFKGEGQTIKATQAGGFNPTKDIPVYVDMWKRGLLDGYEKIITHTISLDEINKGISLMRDGKAGRVMIDME